ncbi:hypothetical protein [Rahnella aquatilis]|uniref:hypothetical protein n=1 Tax=Rahnella aquatilis TaxID=34038 RepID=UPI0006457472|nr:hypothetical protein [Rahnella aquatilis]
MWSNDPSVNIEITENTKGWFVQKSIPSNDGGFFISWLDYENGFSLRMQKLDVLGNLQWPVGAPNKDGILVYQRYIQDYTVDYSLTLDNSGNAVIGIDSGWDDEGVIRPGGKAIACKVSPSGELLFGLTGLVLSPKNDLVNVVNCKATTDGGVAFGWTFDGDRILRVVKIDETGQLVWGDGQIYAASSITLNLGSLEPTEEGGVIFSLSYNTPQKPFTGSEGVPQTHDIVAAKINARGEYAWDLQPKIIYQHSSLDLGISYDDGHSFVTQSDGKGGVIYSYGLQNNDNQWQVKLQHIDFQGNNTYEHIRVGVTDDTTRDHQEPYLGYNTTTGNAYVMWTSATQDSEELTALHAQCLDIAGTKKWGPLGLELSGQIPTSLTALSVAMLPFENSVLASWIPPIDPTTYQYIRTAMISDNGAYLWPDKIVDVKTEATTTIRASGSVSNNNYAAFVWEDNETKVKAQNINPDGTLGVEEI